METPGRHSAHRAVHPSQGDPIFLMTFAATFVGALLVLATLVCATDPFGTLGTGIVPPIVSADRDYKATLYRARRPRPQVVLLGSSRAKTLRPECVTQLTGLPAFNFGVNAGVAEDYLSIFRFMRSQPDFEVREIVVGAEPEAFLGDPGVGRAGRNSRALAPFALRTSQDPERLWTDLWSEASARAALRSAWHYGFDRETLPEEVLTADGFQLHPLWDYEIRRQRYPQEVRVMQSSHDVRARYAAFEHLSPGAVAQLQQLLREARDAGVRVTVFVPPVHPELTREAEGTSLPSLTAELVTVLREAQRQKLLRYVETRSLGDFAGDSTQFYDAIHMTRGNADRLLKAVYQGERRCAVQ
jgi:hypothetical protein